MEVAGPLTSAAHMDGPSFPMMEHAEEPVATTSTALTQPSEFQHNFFLHPARRIQPQRQRQGRFGTHDLDDYILKHIGREGENSRVSVHRMPRH